MFDYREGDLVKHPNRPEWGVGRVRDASPDGQVTVNFSREGWKKLHLGRVSFTLVKMKKTKDAVEQYHREFLALVGKPYGGVRMPQHRRTRRTAHCYNCTTQIDNAVEAECVTCGWIICWCGACGCGYYGRGA